MKFSFLKIFVILTFVIVIGGCGNQSETVKKESEVKEISRVINSCIGWFKNKDFELSYSTVAHDSNYISVHPTDRMIKGFEQFKINSEVFRNPDFKYVRHELKNLTVHLSRSGDVAWFYCVLNDINTWKGQPANWENTRWTGVLEKRDGQWVIVQQHFSFADKG